jgi:hypothetical protein
LAVLISLFNQLSNKFALTLINVIQRNILLVNYSFFITSHACYFALALALGTCVLRAR